MFTKRYSSFFLSVLSILLTFANTSCVLYPRYQRPCIDVPDHWRVQSDQAASYANYRWWEQLNDPILTALIYESLENNNNLKVAIETVYQYAGQLQVARSALYPQLTGNGYGTRQQISTAVFPPFPGIRRITNDFLGVLSASYQLDIWGKIRSGSDAALAQLLAQEDARRTVILTLVGNVASAYVLLRQYDKQLEISRSTFTSRKESFNLAVLRYEGGLTSELEVKQAEGDMEVAAVRVLQFERAIAIQENLISVLVGHSPQVIPRGLLLDDMALSPTVPAGIPSALLEQRPDILQAEHALIAANAQIGVARAAFFPNISLTGTYGNESMALSNLFSGDSTTWIYGMEIFQELFTGGRLTGQLKISESLKWQAYYQYCQTVLEAFKEVDDSLVSYTLSRETFEVQKRRVAAMQEALRLATLQYDNGQVEYLNVLDAERNLFLAQLDMVNAQGDSFLSFVDLYTSLGGGWVIDADNFVTECDSVWPRAYPDTLEPSSEK